MSTIKILIVDDSAFVRQTLSSELSKHKDFEIVGMASDPYQARDIILNSDGVDVILLDIEMPRMDGLTFLSKLMKFKPTPVIVVSSLAKHGSDVAFEALRLGAVEALCKPGSMYALGDLTAQLPEKIRAAKSADLSKLMAKIQSAKPLGLQKVDTSSKVVAIGASTGGVQALEFILTSLPEGFPGTLIVQHMPPGFTKSFADRLAKICRVDVKEASNGDIITAGKVFIAPGNFHMIVRNSGAQLFLEIKEGPLVAGHRPSVDVTFKSLAKAWGRNSIGVLLTGMGSDGAEGLFQLKLAGCHTICQDETTCVVFGMPKQAINMGAATEVLPLDVIPKRLIELLSSPTIEKPHISTNP
ncbi:MAG: chemotaxis response regulator protein-glutamate methylesterase [Deltaproteobacteria bacterium]|nr:chemotaxis response regulator protein-glutamate methylesterase [Deltaproteobacteria bacterium]MCX7952203.1 chemotaxis response regulator protein-glutamate methylesterase [Deltaproteobacteria bacterium]